MLHKVLQRQAAQQRDAENYFQAQQLLEEALRIAEQTLGRHHGDTAHILYDLAIVLKHQRQLDQALDYFKEVLQFLHNQSNPDHRVVAAVYGMMADVFSKKADYAAAQHYFEKAFDIQRRELGDYHEDTIATLLRLARLREGEGDYDDAIKKFSQALWSVERAEGDNRWLKATIHEDLAACLRKMKLFEQAFEHITEAKDLYEEVFGSEHSSVASAFNIGGSISADLKQYKDAEEQYRRALAIYRKIFGNDHPSTATVLANLGGVLFEQGKFIDARDCYEQALAVFEQKLGPDHPSTQTVRQQIAQLP
ncbi:tetratricopeptide repeat protein [Chloroflexus sp.]|uniref:tetratricopeptide repeat protein n=1 Tax=Chloroflexus sp. TaxID=1904827 RepID=UPI0026170CD8|nr:tetratricopeptide repeat protein [uncultured Chloroflexus sp.]